MEQAPGLAGATLCEAFQISAAHYADRPADVRELDIRRDDLEPDAYDLIHCRALLGHLPDPAAALRRMAAGLRPHAMTDMSAPD